MAAAGKPVQNPAYRPSANFMVLYGVGLGFGVKPAIFGVFGPFFQEKLQISQRRGQQVRDTHMLWLG